MASLEDRVRVRTGTVFIRHEPMRIKSQKRLLLIGAILAFVPAHGARAYYVTGNDLLRMCSGSATEQSQCIGYLQGYLDMMQIKLYRSGHSPCPPPGTRIEDMRDAVIRYLHRFPKGHDLMAPSIIGAAIGTTWTCFEQKLRTEVICSTLKSCSELELARAALRKF